MTISTKSEKIAVILLNYNCALDCLAFLESLNKYENNYTVYIVDNDSRASDLSILEQSSYNFILVKSPDNGGYAKGNNIGISRAIADGFNYILLANADTRIFIPNTLKKLQQGLIGENANIIGPELITTLGDIDSGVIISNKYGLTRRTSKYATSMADSIIGAFWMITSQTIKTFGYIPEEYFLYREETDYMERITENGGKIIYYPTVKVIHDHGKTTGSVWDYYFNRNTILFAKNKSQVSNLQIGIFHFAKTVYITSLIALGLNKRTDKWKAIKLTWKGLIDGICNKTGRM